MTPFFLSIFPALFRLGDLSKAIWQWKRWASERAAIKAEVTQAKQTVDLLRPGQSHALTRLMLRLTPSEESQIGQKSRDVERALGASNSSRRHSMALTASFAGITLLALLGGDGVATAADDSKREPNIWTAEAIEPFVCCESSYPLLSVKWDNSDIEKAAQTASAFLEVPTVTPQVIIDKIKECLSALGDERGMMTVDFEQVELRCGVGPDIQRGRVVVVHVN
jgi:Trp operon repressor